MPNRIKLLLLLLLLLLLYCFPAPKNKQLEAEWQASDHKEHGMSLVCTLCTKAFWKLITAYMLCFPHCTLSFPQSSTPHQPILS